MRFILCVVICFLSQGCTDENSMTQLELVHKSYNELTTVAQSIDSQKAALNDFEDFVGIMETYVNDYSTAIKASIYLSNALRLLPIPYAGEVSTATKLISNSLININSTASSLAKYQQSSEKFLTDYAELDVTSNPLALEKLSDFADITLIIDALILQGDMEVLNKTTESLLSTIQLMSDTSEAATSYLDKVKSLISNEAANEATEEEQEVLNKSEDGFKDGLAKLNIHINMLKNSARLNGQRVSRARVIAGLALELEGR